MTDTITTELRESMVDDARGLLYIGETALANLCDAIDAVHANLEAENESLRRELDRVLGEQEGREREGYRKGIMDGCAYYDAEHTECLLSEPHGWVRLPKDADGEYIHIGDVMDSRVDYLFDGKPFTVCALVLCEDGWEVADGRFGNRYEPNSLRHHHEPTVEDVLREFAYGLGVPVADSYVAATAAKLRLAGES